MGILSQEGHLGLRVQSSPGSFSPPGDPLATDHLFVRTRSGATAGDRELLIPDPEIGGNRDVPGAALGPIVFGGEYDLYARARALQFFLGAVLGGWDVDTSTDTGEMLAWGEVDVPWISVEEKIGNAFDTFRYWNAKVNTLHLECDADGLASATAGLIGMYGARMTPTPVGDQRRDDGEIFVGSNTVVTINGVNLHPRSVAVDISNNMEDDDFRLGSLFLGGLTEKRREVTMTVGVRPEDASLWRQAVWGSAAATAPQGQPTILQDVVLSMSTYGTWTSGLTTEPWTVEVALETAIMEPFTVDPSGDDVLEHDITIHMVRPNPLYDGITARATGHPGEMVLSGTRGTPSVFNLLGIGGGYVLAVDDDFLLGV